MRHTMRFLLLLPVFTLLLTPVTPRAQAQAPTMDGYPAHGTAAIVKVESTGAAPRAALRYRIPAGAKMSMKIDTAMSLAMTMGDIVAGKSDLPVMKMTADLAVTNVAANGDVTYDMAFTGMTAEALPGMDASLVAMVQASAAAITSLKGSATVSDRGITRSAKLDLDKITDPNLRQTLASFSSSIESLSMPLPEEAVGAGARWEVRTATQSGGAYMFQKANYELVSVAGDTAVMKVTMEQTTPAQPVNNPALPPGATMEIEKITGTGTGNIRLTMTNLVPTSDLTSTSNAIMIANLGGQSQRMNVDTTVKVTMGPIVK